LPDRARDERLGEVIAEAEQAERTVGREQARKGIILADALREMRRGTALDAGLYFSDLWNTLAYTHFHTIWTPLTREGFLRPRRAWPDPDAGPLPLASRYSYDNAALLEHLRAHLAGRCVKDAAGRWVEDPASDRWAALER